MTSETLECSLSAAFSETLEIPASVPLPEAHLLEAHPGGLIRGLRFAMMLYLATAVGVVAVWKLWHLLF
jgi:hypothetical protein